MNTQKLLPLLIRYIFTFALFLFAAGCSDTGNPDVNESRSSLLVTADAGDIVAVRLNQSVILDGSGSSTTSASPLTYAWSFTSKPEASTAELQNATSVNPGFIADAVGTYMVQLVVSAGGVSSQRAIASVEVTTDGWFTGKHVHLNYPSQCADCHDGRFATGIGAPISVPVKSGDHLGTSNMCQACHTTFGFNLIRFVDHLEVFGNCSTCHDGVLAVGKSDFHVATTAECDNCHTTTSFLQLGPDGRFDHSGITRACSTCHNGITAIGKHETHFVTDTDCGSCHTTDNFKSAYVDHSNITDNCASCHNGIDAMGPTVGHPVMAVDCNLCHSTTGFSLGGVFTHRIDASVQPCAGCHNDNNSINARGKLSTPNHIPTTSDCGTCHNTVTFADGIFDHTGRVDNCAECHGDGGNGTGFGKPPNHMPTTEDCSVCHTPGTFATGVFDHDPAVVDFVTCDSCHNDVITAGKDFNHVPTSEDCRVCHLSTDTFAGTVFSHTGITGGCATCHNGVISPGKSSNHLPTTRDCSDCHDVSNFVDFTGAMFDHVGIDPNDCSSCHNGVIAIGKKVNHIPAQVECSQCHIDTNTAGFASPSLFLSNVHPDLSNGCEGCHISQYFPNMPTVVKTANHLPTSQDCHVCHTNTTFNPAIFDHSGITGNCASCHDGSANNVATGALGKTPTPPHPDTTADCGLCHGVGANFSDGIFDHTGRVDNCAECHGDGAPGATTKKNAGHVPTTQDCSLCHVPGTFAAAVFSHDGIVDNCVMCHEDPGAVATVKSTNHLPTTEDCSVCHNTTAFAGARFDHQGVVSNCASCHNGTIAMGKHGNHVPTNNDCSVCHLTAGFIPATFDHVGIVDNCQSCHNGNLATGKPNNHIQTNQDCGVCHNVPTNNSGFIPATFDHSSVSSATRCDSCHGVTSTGMPQDHIPTNLDCRSCHTTATFVGGTWVHDASTTGVCKSCHSSGGGATPQPTTGHIATDLQCDACHVTDRWAPTTFSHDPQGNYPGDHRRSPGCSACHGNIVTIPFVYPPTSDQYAPFCAACHAGDFRRKDKHNGGSNGTIEQNKDCSGGGRGCHQVSDTGFD